MSVTSFATLKTELAAWMARDDLTARIEVFIQMTESDLNKRLRTRRQEGRSTSSTTAGEDTIALPDDYGSARNLTITSTDPYHDLEFYSPQGLEEAYPHAGNSRPKGWAIIGSEIYLRPVPDAAYTVTLDYFATIPALSDSNTTNWVLTNYPDVYLFGGLAQYGLFTRQADLVGMWQPKYEAEIGKLELAEQRATAPRGKLHARVPSRMVV